MPNLLKTRSRRLIAGTAFFVLLGTVTFWLTRPAQSPASGETTCLDTPPAAVALPGGTALIGSNRGYPEERPARKISIAPINIDATEVTNAQFRAFIDATGYVTDAEKPQPGFDMAGGAVFTLPGPSNPSWWKFVAGANWRHPEGPDSHIEGRDNDPVVQVTLTDARAYAAWAKRRLPREAEWEYAARAGSETAYVWGAERTPDGREMANYWQGAFPVQNSLRDGYGLRAPVGCFAPNDFGLYDMIGNVWEWTETRAGGTDNEPVHVIKGGSFLCAENYCRRYRAPARQFHESGFSTNHIGFRTIK
ncbi:MAG: formylglycine-generating enzyme family protein [Parvibaculales bacterium]